MCTSERTGRRDGQIRRVTVARSGIGWDIREEYGSQLVRTTNYRDWHRVERAVAMFERLGAVTPDRREGSAGLDA